MSEQEPVKYSCVLCNRELEGTPLPYEEFTKDLLTYASRLVGYRCGTCGAVFCESAHKDILKPKFFGRGYGDSKCTDCGTLLAEGDVLLSSLDAISTTPESKPISGAAFYFYGQHLEDELAKNKRTTKGLMIWAIISTVLAYCVMFPLMITLQDKMGDDIVGVIAPLMGFVGLGIFAWPFVLWKLVQRSRLKALLERLPEPGPARLEFVKAVYEKKGWAEVQGGRGLQEGSLQYQEVKKFNILLALLGFLFGLIGFLMYMSEFNKPGMMVDLIPQEDGRVQVVEHMP